MENISKSIILLELIQNSLKMFSQLKITSSTKYTFVKNFLL